MVDASKFIDECIGKIREDITGPAIIALSGGVDSSVAAFLSHQAIGDDLHPVFIDTGLMRKGEVEEVKGIFKSFNLRVIDAKDRFFNALEGLTDPEDKRKAVGETFIRVFEDEADKDDAEYLIQGTIYPDRIESEGGIKSHHNVGGLPTHIGFKKIIEPLRDLYKDEVRDLARAMDLPKSLSERMPFPGPGLSVRVVGEVTYDKVDIVREATSIVEKELSDYQPWQAFAVLLTKGTGVKGDIRNYGWIIAVRAVESRDGMTADALSPQWDSLHRIASRITSEIEGVSRVVYDITPKPPATIEFE